MEAIRPHTSDWGGWGDRDRDRKFDYNTIDIALCSVYLGGLGLELSNRGIRQTTELFSRRDDSFSERTGFLQHKKTEFQSRRVTA